jgi:hypothetical protein
MILESSVKAITVKLPTSQFRPEEEEDDEEDELW